MAGLKDFQRATVHHVMDRFFGADPTRRFLVADETGLGKSVVARGIIAETLERLQDDDCVERVDVIGFHRLGEPKYAALGIPFPMADVPAPSQEQLQRIRRRPEPCPLPLCLSEIPV